MTDKTGGVDSGAGRSARLTTSVAIALGAYLVCLSVFLSNRRMMWLDEFFAWGILTDPSMGHAMHAWLEGADSGGVLYYILGHALLSITGPSVLAARLFGAVLLAGAFVLWFRVLLRVFDGYIALIAGCVWLLSVGTINYLAEVRFYPLLLAAVVLAMWLALWVQRGGHVRWLLFLLCFLVHGALVSSHLLGIVYSGLILLALMACANFKRHLAAAAGIVTSWSLLLIARQPIHIGGLRVAGMQLARPHWNELFAVYLLQPSAFAKINAVVYLLLGVTAVQWLLRKGRIWPLQDDARSLLLRISLLLAAAPALFFAESRVAPWSLWVVRYMLPAILGISGLTAFMLKFQRNELPKVLRSRQVSYALLAAMLLVEVGLHIGAVRRQVLRPSFTAAQLRPVEQGVPIAVGDEQLFFQLRFYTPVGASVYFVSPGPGVPWRFDLMTTIARQGYWGGGIRSRDEFLRDTGDFLLIEDSQKDTGLLEQVRQEGWTITPVGIDNFGGRQASLLRVTRPKS